MPLENVKDSRVLLFIVTHNRQCCFVTLGIDKNIAMHSMQLLHCYTWKRQHLLQYNVCSIHFCTVDIIFHCRRLT